MLLAKISEKLDHYAEQYGFSHTTPASQTSPIVQLNQAQSDWMRGKGLSFFCKKLTHLHSNAIDASAGSSSYVPPDCIEQELKSIETINIIEYNSHIPTAHFTNSAEKYFQEIGVIDKKTGFFHNAYEAASPETYTAMVGHGTTELFNKALLTLLKTPHDVVILTQPVYGLFVQPILSKGGNVAALSLQKRHGYKPHSETLAQLILSENKRCKLVYLEKIEVTLSLLKALPFQNLEKKLKPLFTILIHLKTTLKDALDKADFKAIDTASTHYNRTLSTTLSALEPSMAGIWSEKLSLSLCPRVRGYLNINPHMPMGTICDQSEIDALAEAISPFPDLTVIDDLTYYDLVLPGAKKGQPGTFAKSPLKNKTITLYSPSKQFAVAGVRAGICFGPQAYILPITKDIFYGVNTTSIYSDTTLQAIFKMKPQERIQYLQENNEGYALNRDLSIMLIEGTNNFDAERIKAVSLKLTSIGIKKADVSELLLGIPGLKILTKPHAGFFLMLDFSHFKGKFFGKLPLKSGLDFRNALYSFTNLDTIPGELCFYFEKPVLRFSYCLKPKDIVEGIYRIKALLKLCQDQPFQKSDKVPEKKVISDEPQALTPQFKAKARANTKQPLHKTIRAGTQRKAERRLDPNFTW